MVSEVDFTLPSLILLFFGSVLNYVFIDAKFMFLVLLFFITIDQFQYIVYLFLYSNDLNFLLIKKFYPHKNFINDA